MKTTDYLRREIKDLETTLRKAPLTEDERARIEGKIDALDDWFCRVNTREYIEDQIERLKIVVACNANDYRAAGELEGYRQWLQYDKDREDRK